ncbi:CorA metal ion transporter, partial [Coemansia nantahalensis]
MDGSKASAVEAAPPTGDASSAPPSCESSALWVWMGGDSSSSKSGGEHSARNRPCGDGKAGSGRVMFYSGQTGAVHASTVQAVADSSGVGLAGLAGRAQRGAAKSGDAAPFWLDVAGATARELHELADLFGLHPLTVEDIEQGCSRDKLDVFGDYLFVVYHTVGSRRRDEGQSYCHYGQSSGSIGPAASGEWGAGCSDSDGDDGGGPICIVLKRNAVLTFHRRGLQPAVERVAARLAAIGAAAAEAAGDDEMLGRLAEYPAYIVYAILDEATDRLGPEIAEIERQVDALDELVLALTHDEHESALRHMGEQRRRILQMWQLAQPKAVVVAALGKALGAGGRQPSVVSLLADAALAAEVVQYLADVHEH